MQEQDTLLNQIRSSPNINAVELPQLELVNQIKSQEEEENCKRRLETIA